MHSPGHNATHQHHSTPAPQHNKEPTTRNQQQPQQQTTTPPPTPPKQQSTTENQCTVKKKQQQHGIPQHQATTATTVPSSCGPHRKISRIDARACAQNKGHRQQQQQLQRKITSHGIKRNGNSVATSGDSGSALLRFLVSNSAKRTRVTLNPRKPV